MNMHAVIARSLNGDSKATQTLVRQLSPVIRSQVRARLRGSNFQIYLDDFVQETWLSLFENNGQALRRYDGQRTLEIYVSVIARRTVKDCLRRHTAKKRGGQRLPMTLSVHALCDPTANSTEACDLMHKLMHHLDHRFTGRGQRVLHCLHTDGRSVLETALFLNITCNAVAVWQTKIRRCARVWLAAV